MKFGKILLLVLGIAAVILLVIGFIAPKESLIKRETTINAPREVIWEHVRSLEAQHKWSPWAKRDKEMVISFEGKEGEIGSKYAWKGNKNVGEGYQIIKALEPMNSIEQDLVFTSPFESKALVTLNITNQDKEQLVSWSFKTEFGFFTSIFMFFNDMDASLGPDFEEGLSYLKAICEEDALKNEEQEEVTFEVDGQIIIEKQFGPTTYIGVKKTVKWADMSTFFSENYGKIKTALEAAGYEIEGKPSAIYFNWDEENQQADVAATFAIKGLGISMEGFEAFEVNPGLACQITYYGSYEGIGAAHEALGKHIAARGFTQSLAIEEYANDPSEVANPSELMTIITYPVKMSE